MQRMDETHSLAEEGDVMLEDMLILISELSYAGEISPPPIFGNS